MAGAHQTFGLGAGGFAPDALPEPIRLCIAALGGEGGSVLTSWIVSLARAENWPVQSTSIPGVAQRTGATTYYIEILPRPWDRPGRPVLALTPTPGFVEVVVATELLEAGRAVEQGLVSPDRTTIIASTHRAYTIEEKSAMSDERIPTERILRAIDQLSARAIHVDFARLAHDSGAVVSSVVLGAIAGAGVLPVPRERFEESLRASGIAVEANLRGFAAAFDAVTGRQAADSPPAPAAETRQAGLGFPAEVETVAAQGVARLIDYQGAGYADRYTRSVTRVLEAEREMVGEGRGWPVTREAARYLALMMSYEDIIRVAALKTARGRWDDLHGRTALGPNDVIRVTEFLKPGIEEFASLLPPRLGRLIIEAARRRGKLDSYNLGMGIRTTSVTGFMTMRFLARLQPWRPRSYRFSEEIAAIDKWLDLVVGATRIDPAFGAEVVECARIRKGYGSTHRRGAANFEALMEEVARPAVAARRSEAGTLAELRALALSDPEGTAMLDALRGRKNVAIGREGPV